MPQVELDQPNFGLGMFMGWDALSIPDGGSWDIENGLQGDDGMLIRRGGPTNLTASFSPKGLRFIWAGQVSAGYRILIANEVGFGSITDGWIFEPLGTNGDASMDFPTIPAVIQGYLFIPAADHLLIYAGSRKAAQYNVGTVDLLNGSTAVTGTGTLWEDNIDAGFLLEFTVGPNQGVFAVKTVINQTSLELDRAWTGDDETGSGYLGQAVFQTHWAGTEDTPYPDGGGYVANVGNRLVLGDSDFRNTVYFSNVGDPHGFGQFNYHVLPEGRRINAIQPLGQSGAIFTDRDVWRLDGLPFEIVSPDGTPQHQLQRIVGEDILVPQHPMAGIVPYQDGLIVPCLDGIFLIDQSGQATRLSRSIDAMWAALQTDGIASLPDVDPPGVASPGAFAVTLGGAAVYDDHYFLPLLGDGLEFRTLTVLVCRLDRPRETELGVVFPWSRLSGNGGNVSAYTVGSFTGSPDLLGASNVDEDDEPAPDAADCACVLVASSYFPRADTTSQDPDGSDYLFQVTPRLIPTGEGLENTVRFAKLFYELDDGYSTNPALDLEITSDYVSYTSVGSVAENPVAAEAPRLRIGPPRRRHMALRVECPDRTDKLILRSIRYFLRPAPQRRN